MSELSKLIDIRKEQLIEALISKDVFKTSDQQHLYDAPLNILEAEYRMILKKEAGQ